jgi:uroporphyrinogen decarboxylase
LAAALNHQEADRIPFDLGSTKVTGININAYKGFLAYKGWGNADPIPAIADPVQQLALVNEEVLCAVGADTRGLMPLAGGGFTRVSR